MKSTEPQARTASYRPRRAALNGVDYLVIAATVLVFATIVAVNNPHAARAQSRLPVISAAELPVQTGQLPEPLGLIKAKIGLATARPWG